MTRAASQPRRSSDSGAVAARRRYAVEFAISRAKRGGHWESAREDEERPDDRSNEPVLAHKDDDSN